MRRSFRAAIMVAVMLAMPVTSASGSEVVALVTENPQTGQPITFRLTFGNCLSGQAPPSVSWGLHFSKLDPQTGTPVPYPAHGAGKSRVPAYPEDLDFADSPHLEVGITAPNSSIDVTVELPPGTYHPRVFYGCYYAPDLVGSTGEITDWAPYEFTVGPVFDGPRSRDPIIFVPGMMGSKLSCGTDELWTDFPSLPEIPQIALQPNGFSDMPGACRTPIRQSGILDSVGPRDIYAPAVEFIQSYAAARERRSYVYAYDWRHSPERSVPGLRRLVERAKRESGSDSVMIVGHSMGGLLAQIYIRDAADAANVSRVVTIGTPYWGSPKSWLGLSHGWIDNEFFPLDWVIANNSLKVTARNLAGVFSLYPSANYIGPRGPGQWLSMGVDTPGSPLARLDMAGVANEAERFGATRQLVVDAQELHANRIDKFVRNGVDYHAIVGAGIPTVGAIDDSLFGDPRYSTVDGDGTVPLLSQTQGAVIGTSGPFGEPVTFSRVCDVEHMDEAGDPQVTPILDHLLDYEGTVPGIVRECPRARRWQLTLRLGPLTVSGSRVRVAAVPTSLKAARERGDIEILPSGSGQVTIITRTDDPLTLPVAASAIRITPLSPAAGGRYASGVTTYYVPPAGKVATIVLGATRQVSVAGAALSAVSADRAAPTIVPRIRHVGRFAVVTFVARDASGVAGIFVRNGRRYAKLRGVGYRVAWTRRTRVTYYATDRFGNTSRPKRLR